MNSVKTNHKNLLQSDVCLDFLQARQVSIAAIEKFQLGYEIKKISNFRDRILFPLFDPYGFCIGNQGRALTDDVKPKYWHTKGIDKGYYLFGLFENQQQIVDDGYVALAEGNFDVVVLWMAGIPAVASMGSAFTWRQALLLRRYTDTVIIVPDNDKAGTIATENRIEQLKEFGFKVFVASVDRKVKDVDELYQLKGRNAVAKTIFDAEEY